jgi:hypothetical protein
VTDDQQQPGVRPLDASGEPIAAPPVSVPAKRTGTTVAIVVGAVAVAAIVAVVAWRTILGSPFTAAEAVPADADVVITMDFLQIRDLDKVDRLIQAFAEPMAEHDIIDDVPDLEAALAEFDDAMEEEVGFRFAEDVLSWIGRSGSLAFWIPDEVLDPAALEVPEVPDLLLTLEVTDQAAAQDFLDLWIGEIRESGAEVETVQVAGVQAYASGGDAPAVVMALEDERLIIASGVDIVRRAIEVDVADSVAQTDDFQELASVIGGDPLMTFYLAPSLMETFADVVEQGGGGPMTGQLPDTGVMAAMTLDDYGAGLWALDLPARTYGFIDVVIPEDFMDGIEELMDESMAQAGVAESDVDEMTGPIDDMLGMSLTDDLLPQFGGEMLFAVVPASDGMFARDLGADIGMLFGMGVADSAVVQDALDRLVDIARDEGVTVETVDGVTVMDDGAGPIAAMSVTDDALLASTSPDAIGEFASGGGALGEGDTFTRTDGLVQGDGMVFYVDINAIVDDFVTEDEVRDVLAPLVSIGAGFVTEGDYVVSDVRLVIDY